MTLWQSFIQRVAGTVGIRDGHAFALGKIAAADLPTCNASRQFEERVIPGAAGVADRKVRCEKDAANAFAWNDVGFAANDTRYVNVAGDTMTGDLTVPDEVYGVAWNGSLEVPTKNAVYDKIETVSGGGVSDGDKGDITVSAVGTVWTIDNDVVTYAKMQNVSATDKLLGRSTAGAGDVEEITLTAAGRALIDDASATAQIATLGLDADIATLSLPASTVITAAAATVLDDATVGAMLTTLGGQPLDTDLTDIAAIAGVQGDVIIRGSSAWQRLGAGTSGQYLQTAGAAANPAWAAAPGAAFGMTTVQVDLGSTPRIGGNFAISTTGLTTGDPVMVTQVGGAYTGKGVLTDEAELGGVIDVAAYAESTTSIRCYWSSPFAVRGFIKVAYAVNASIASTSVTGLSLVWLASNTPSAAAGSSFDSVFTSTYQTYLLVYRLAMSASNAAMVARLRVGGVDASGANYYYGGHDTNAAATASARGAAAATSWTTLVAAGVGTTWTDISGTIMFASPQETDETVMSSTFGARNSVPGHFTGYTGCTYNATTSYDGVSLIPGSGTITGRLTLFGVRN